MSLIRFCQISATVLLVSTAMAVDPADRPEEILATFTGGEITRGDLETARPILSGTGTPQVQSFQVRQLAIYRYLHDLAGAREPDALLRMRITSAEAAILKNRFIERRKEVIAVTEQEVLSEMENVRHQLQRPEQRRLRNLFKSTVGLSAPEAEEVRARMVELRQGILEGGDFAAVARVESDSANRLDGGLVGTVARGKLDPELERVIFSLKSGEMSEIISFGRGLHLFLCERIDPPRALPEEEVRSRIRQNLRERRWEDEWKELGRSWVSEAAFDPAMLQSGESTAIALAIPGREPFTVGDLKVLLTSGKGGPLPPSEEVRARIESLLISLRAAGEYLAVSAPDQTTRDRIEWMKRRLTAEREIEIRLEALGSVPPPEEATLQNTYESQRDELVTDRSYLIETLTLRIEPDALASDTAHLQSLRENLAGNASETFLSLATRDFPKEMLERIRVVAPEWKTELEIRGLGRVQYQAFQELEPGETSAVFRTLVGGPALWLMRLDGIRESRPITFEEARPGLIRYHRERELERRRSGVVTSLLEEMRYTAK